jgi:hypothetical protein
MALLSLPSFEIPRPPVEPPLHGLLDAAYTPDLSSLPEGERSRWESGISFPPASTTCNDKVEAWMSGSDDPQDKAAPGVVPPFNTFRSFVLTYTMHCMALPTQIEPQIELAKQALIAGTPQAVEAIFWGPNDDGTLTDLYSTESGNFSLSGATPLVTGYDADSCNGILNRNTLGSDIVAKSPKQALLALTQALGNCGLGARGMIHAPVYLAEDWASQQLARLSDNDDVTSPLITNVRGDYVVGGSGYSGVGPAAHTLREPADGHAWAYATGPVGVLLNEPRESDTTIIDNRTNLHKIIVERDVAIAASDSCLFAVYVDVA